MEIFSVNKCYKYKFFSFNLKMHFLLIFVFILFIFIDAFPQEIPLYQWNKRELKEGGGKVGRNYWRNYASEFF